MTSRRIFLARAAGMAAFSSIGRSWGAADADLLERARSLLSKAPLIDTHNDLPALLLETEAGDLTKFDLSTRQPTLCADVPALREGRVGAQYWSIYVDSATQQTHVALHEALRVVDVALRVIRSQPAFEQARTADDIERIQRKGRIACLLGVEGGHMVENSPAALRVFYELGARYLTLTHWDNVDWADAATDRVQNYGLTDLGKQLVREMNRLGMFVDLSHVSVDTMRDALSTSRAPVIFSHACAYAINPHPRNVPDDVLRALKENGGVIHVNFILPFVSPDGYAWEGRRAAQLRRLRAALPDEATVAAGIAAWEQQTRLPRAGIEDVADHIDHIRRVAGIDHIGIGADFYEAGDSSMANGLGNVTRYSYLFAELLRRGYADGDVLKIAGGNHLRAMRAMEAVAADLQRTAAPLITEGLKAKS